MSEIGKLTRGYKWYSMRDIDGNLPDAIANDPAKMCDVEFYLEHIKDHDEKLTNKTLMTLRDLGRRGKKNNPVYEAEAAKIGYVKDRVTASDGSHVIAYKKEDKKPKKKEEK